MQATENSAHFDLRDLFNALRVMPGVEERIPGIYRHGGARASERHPGAGRNGLSGRDDRLSAGRSSSGWDLHFHEGTAGFYATLRVEGYWMRYPVNSELQRVSLLQLLKAALPEAKVAAPQPPGHGRVIAPGMKLEPRKRGTQRRTPNSAVKAPPAARRSSQVR